MQYEEFLRGKLPADAPSGFNADEALIPPEAFPFQRALIRWAVRRGRAAIFADTGLGKTLMQCAWARQVSAHVGPVLIVAPLAVARQTVAEAGKFGIEVVYRRDGEVAPIVATNYEMLNRFDLTQFSGIVLDESSILKGKDGKTRAKILADSRVVPYRLSCTATPSPNDHMELGAQCEFLGVMSEAEMLAMYFTHDSGDTSKWRLKGHGKAKFWEWMSTWAAVVRRPSDLGDDDSDFALPPLTIREHVVASSTAIEGELFPRAALTLTEQRQAQRATIEERCQEVSGMVNASREPWIIWCHLNDESDLLAQLIPDAVAIKGSDSPDEKESRMSGFTDGSIRVLVTKPSIAGFGMNWQHCNRVAFVGLSHSFEQFYQAIRRCWRFGQQREVTAHLFTSELEGQVMESIKRKERQHDEVSREMADHMREFMRREIMGATNEKIEYVRDVANGDGWTLHLGDCIDVVREIDSESVDYTIFSPPFASLYTYSASERDMGNVADDEEFARHFAFLVPELFRVTRPGRLLSFHCMNLPTSKSRHGFIGIRDFRGELIRVFSDAGWIFHSEVCIWKDPVTSMQRTKALGLLHKQLKKDSCMSRQGIPDYLVTMRKPGENTRPVTHTNESFPVERWQRYASPVWMDIDQSRTLNYRAARENEDERHICPLQLDVIERAMDLWTNPGDLVLSPFAGVGSEGYVAIQTGRQFIGSELKRSYWEMAQRNLDDAGKRTGDLFSGVA